MALRAFGTKTPVVDKGAFVDEDALVIGRVHLGERATVWPRALIRADDEDVDIGAGTAVMDMAFVEAPKGSPVKVGSGCIVSHGAKLHGCTVGDDVLIGIGATVLDGATVDSGSIVAAGSLVTPKTTVPKDSLVMGAPAKVVRSVTPFDKERLRDELIALARKAEMYRKTR
jgi:carbonic anhydrase/acetyltransferase-like protein (isoleucine patch superfamily)